MKMHGHSLEVQLYTNFSICNRLTSLHIQSIFTQHPSNIAFVFTLFLFVHTHVSLILHVT